jgi:hypothetical protein
MVNQSAFQKITEAELEAAGLRGAILDDTRGTLTFQFVDREEVWTKAPAGYPVDGSVEVLRFNGVYYIPPPEGPAA